LWEDLLFDKIGVEKCFVRALNGIKGKDMGVYFMGVIGIYSVYETYWKDMGAYTS
jgi:hypothetical protein